MPVPSLEAMQRESDFSNGEKNLVTITVRPVQENVYRPQQLMVELGLGRTQFCLWVKALGMTHDGKRKHFYDAKERAELLRFRSLLNRYNSLELAFSKWLEQDGELSKFTAPQ
jgi:hypothetical protein